jgi:hypothetical protein
VEARKLIIAQAMAGGEPAEEMTAPVAEDQDRIGFRLPGSSG